MSNDQLQKWALIAEIFGGIAVIVSLLLLVSETRENTRVMRAATYDAITADIADLRMTIATDESLREIIFITKTEGRQAFTPRQQNMDELTSIAAFQHYERAYIQWELGNLDDEAWERFRNILCSASVTPGFEDSFGPLLDRATTKNFANYRKTQCPK
jgi:hypothetical protein